MTFVNYAHRGASEYAPENTLSSFYLGYHMGANGIETDVQMTRDGVMVLFHDDTLLRVTGEEGSISDHTYQELLKMRVRNPKNDAEDIIVSFEDFLRFFSFRPLTFAIEIKQSGFEEKVLDMLDKYGMREKTTVTSFNFECIARVKELRPDYRVGYLTYDFDDENISQMKSIGGEQLCPKAKNITDEKVRYWHGLGFEVRAWGVSDVSLMKAAYDSGVDGMTVNFPNLLVRHITQNNR